MLTNEFNQVVAVDFAPHNSLCEWCGKPAVEQLTAIGGKYHNKGGFFCLDCGEVFTHLVTRDSSNVHVLEKRQMQPVPA